MKLNTCFHKAIIWKSPMPVNSYLMARLTVYPMDIASIIFINELFATSVRLFECLTFFTGLDIAFKDLFVVMYLLVIFTNVLMLDHNQPCCLIEFLPDFKARIPGNSSIRHTQMEAGMSDKVKRPLRFLFLSGLLMNLFVSALWGQDKPKGPPPAIVSVAPVKTGNVAPQAEFIGTVFYQEVSDVASELSGLVEEVLFEEGQRIKKSQVLIRLGSDILNKRLLATSASYEQILSELEIARIEFKRSEKLFKTRAISEQSYDENRFRVKGIVKRAESLKAEVERIEIELQKKIIRAPFDGIVIKRQVDRGEWLAEGATVAILAKDDVVDIVSDVSEEFVPFIQVGMPVKATINGNEISGSVIAVVPRGDVATRTFPVKVRTPNTMALIEGMSARVVLPVGTTRITLVVPRDAVITVFGQTVVYAVKDSKAQMIRVNVIGYQDLVAGVESERLAEGMQVVVKGNERLRDGQMVSIVGQKE